MGLFRRLAVSAIVPAMLTSTLPLPHMESIALAETEPQAGLDYARSMSKAFEQVAATTTPSVVNIKATKKAKANSNRPQMPRLPDPFFDFFGEDFLERHGGGDPVPQEGLGTGVIISAEGHILTNNHVVGDADEVEVRVHNRTEALRAEVVGTDPRSDLAVIKIKPNGLNITPAKLGDSDHLKIGEWVLAIGNPFNLDHTVTAGIVSAKGRDNLNQGQYEDFIQTDAAINPGNSGGPLVNLNGEVVGINTAIFSRSGGYMGIGFAIPSNMAKMVSSSLIEKGKVVRGWLGVVIQPLTEELAKSFEYAGTEGALVGQVQPESPADKAGLKQGDIITEFGGTKIKNVNHLRNLVAQTSPGNKIDVVLLRGGKRETLAVKIEELPAQTAAEAKTEQTESNIGVTVDSLTPELAQRLGSKRTRGVVITNVTPGSIAAAAMLTRGDIITSVNGQEIESAKEFRRLLTDEALKKGVRLLIESNGMERFAILRSKE